MIRHTVRTTKERKKMESLKELERKTVIQKESANTDAPKTQNQETRESRKEQSKQIRKVEKEIADRERQIAKLEAEIVTLEAKLAAQTGSYDVALFTKHYELKQRLNYEMDKWTELTLELENLKIS